MIREDEGFPSPSAAPFQLVCLSGYIKHLGHLLLGNIEVFTDSMYVCIYGIVLFRTFHFVLKKEINKFKLDGTQSQYRYWGGFGGGLWTDRLHWRYLLVVL